MLGPYRTGEDMKRIEAVELSTEEVAAILTGKIPPVSGHFDELLRNFPEAELKFELDSEDQFGRRVYIVEASAEEEILKP
jgi:hypothetical protein